ncbi:MAG: hypothetical protein H0U07_03285 [Actinobacteria bacterium]|nr:hypothetical protein [Actinomycetota bacterium]
MDGYFNESGINRERLVWTVATRRQLERWELLVAAAVREAWADRQLSGADVWSAQIEHHFTLVAARHLLHALDLDPATSVSVNPILRAELIEGRDLHEHWPENMPVFNVRPRVAEPQYRSGKDFAARNPDTGPYDWLEWSNQTGAQLLPHVSAPALHELLDAVEAEVLGRDATLSKYVPPRVASPWLHKNGEWWPTATAVEKSAS